jgi:uncharacterized protein YciI
LRWPDYRQARLDELQEQRLAYLASFHGRGVLLLAGPFRDGTDGSLRGLCILDLGLPEASEVMSLWAPRGSLPASAS